MIMSCLGGAVNRLTRRELLCRTKEFQVDPEMRDYSKGPNVINA